MARKAKKPRAPSTARKRPPLTKRIILQAALGIVEREGADELSMRKIASHLDCSVAGPYIYFESQDAIIQALIAEGEERLTRRLKAARETKTDVYDQITVLMRTYRDFASKNRELHKLMFANGGRGRSFSLISPSYRVYFETLRGGARTGAIRYNRAGYHAIARAMWSWGYGLVVLELTRAPETRRSEIDPIDEGMELFKRLLRAGENGRVAAPPQS